MPREPSHYGARQTRPVPGLTTRHKVSARQVTRMRDKSAPSSHEPRLAPVHPGEVLDSEFLEPLALTKGELAERLRHELAAITPRPTGGGWASWARRLLSSFSSPGAFLSPRTPVTNLGFAPASTVLGKSGHGGSHGPHRCGRTYPCPARTV